MKLVRLIAAAGAAFCVLAATHVAVAQTLSVPPLKGRPGYRLEIQGDLSSEAGARLVITDPKGASTTIAPAGGLVSVHDAVEGAPPGPNLIQSKYVYASARLPEGMFIVFGRPGDPDPGAIRVVRLGAKPSVTTVLSEDTFLLTAIEAHGGDVLIVGKRSLSQMFKKCLATYDPYAVFKLTPGEGGRFEYQAAESKAYNIKHYGGWAGDKGREDIAVNTCAKPMRIVKAPKAPR
jgi:hypothetical protein